MINRYKLRRVYPSVRLCLCLLVSSLMVPDLAALNLKILSVDHDKKVITALLPMHNTSIEARLETGEDELRVLPNHFYEAELQHQGVDPRKKNLLTVKLPDKSKVRFRLQKIVFIDPVGSR